jgi:TFIIB zinc-binding
MEIDLDNKNNNNNNNLRWLSKPDYYYYLQPQSEKYKAEQGMKCSNKNDSDNDLSYYERVNNNDGTCCSLCKSTFTIFDYTIGEIVCSTCGMVINDYMESEPEWRTFSDSGMVEISKKIEPGDQLLLLFTIWDCRLKFHTQILMQKVILYI